VNLGVEVNRVSQILTCDRILRGHVHFLRPKACTQGNDIVGVPTDDRDDSLVVWLDGAVPLLPNGLIVDLEKNVGITTILAGHLVEEAFRLTQVLFRMVVMPINHDINASSDASINNGL